MDNWVPGCGRLIDVSANHPLDHVLLKNVAEYVDTNGNWLLDNFKEYVPNNVVQDAVAMIFPQMPENRNVLAWSLSSDESFLIMWCIIVWCALTKCYSKSSINGKV